MRILGVDTSTSQASAALVEDERLILEQIGDSFPVSRGPAKGRRVNHAEGLLPLIERLLEKAGWSLERLEGVAVSVGPGSFTGLRVGVSTVKGLTYGTSLPLVGIPTLQAVAARVQEWPGWICPFLDARKREVYTALFLRESSGALDQVMGDRVCPAEEMLREVGARIRGRCVFIGDGITAYGSEIGRFLGEEAVTTLGETYPSTAYGAACLASRRLRQGEWNSPASLNPLYLRLSEAELKRTEGGKGQQAAPRDATPTLR